MQKQLSNKQISVYRDANGNVEKVRIRYEPLPDDPTTGFRFRGDLFLKQLQ